MIKIKLMSSAVTLRMLTAVNVFFLDWRIQHNLRTPLRWVQLTHPHASVNGWSKLRPNPTLVTGVNGKTLYGKTLCQICLSKLNRMRKKEWYIHIFRYGKLWQPKESVNPYSNLFSNSDFQLVNSGCGPHAGDTDMHKWDWWYSIYVGSAALATS